MHQPERLVKNFEENRSHLRAVAYRMLGSLSEADDAVQEAWLRFSRADAGSIENLGGWLSTVVARICLDMLRSRTRRGEESLDVPASQPLASRAVDPEQETLLSESVGLALLVVLDRLNPAERIAFVLHDMFAVSFNEIADITGRSPTSARQLASRARRRVKGRAAVAKGDLIRQREVAEAFLAALREGDFEALVGLLDPDVVVRFDKAAARPGAPGEIRGAEKWARQTMELSRIAAFVRPVLVQGTVGLLWAPQGHLRRVIRFVIADKKIVEVSVIADTASLRALDLAILD